MSRLEKLLDELVSEAKTVGYLAGADDLDATERDELAESRKLVGELRAEIVALATAAKDWRVYSRARAEQARFRTHDEARAAQREWRRDGFGDTLIEPFDDAVRRGLSKIDSMARATVQSDPEGVDPEDVIGCALTWLRERGPK